MKKLLTILFAVALGLNLSAQVPDYVPTDGLVAWYPFDSSIEDESVNSFNLCTNSISYTDGRHGDVGGAFLGVYGGDLLTSCSPNDSWTDEISYALWFQPFNLESDPYPSGWFALITMDGWNHDSFGTLISDFGEECETGHIRVRTSWPNNQWFADCGEIDTGHWHHLCVTGNEESSSVFLDGELLFSSQHSAETTFTEVPFEWTVGASARSHTYQFKGAIDEVGIWNRALTEEEILALYNAPAPTPGCTDWNADNYDPNANIEDGSCLYSGCFDMEADNYDSQANTGDQEALCEYNGCTNEAADNYDPNANVDDGSCVGEGCMTDVCEYYGCTDWNADNYNPNANIEDGSCLYSGCMDMEADNYDSQANTGDQEALCEYNGCTNEAADNYDPHANEDNGTCIVPGCMYEEATNYNAAATYDNLSCEFMIPSVHCGEGTYWDDFAQACLTIVTCQQDLDGDGVIGINDLMELLSSFGTMCEEPETGEFTCGDPINYHGCDYATVQIGEQCWFAENLRTELYQNGDSIPLLESGWTQLSSPAFTSFNNDSELSDVYGYLYNWFAIAGSNICPVDWRVSTQQDFTILHQELGGEEIAGGRMKEEGVDFWQEPNEGATNSSGLTALPGGWLNGGSDEFFDLGLRAGWWTSSEYSVALGVGHWLLYNQENASFPGVDKKDGYSVRCIKDTEE